MLVVELDIIRCMIIDLFCHIYDFLSPMQENGMQGQLWKEGDAVSIVRYLNNIHAHNVVFKVR